MSTNYKADFPLLAQRDVAYLDSAATAQRPQCVLDAEREFYTRHNANPLRGLYPLSIEVTEALESARAAVARFLGAAQSEEIVFTRNTTEGLNLVAYSYGLSHVKAGDEILISTMEHHSNILPWQMVCRQTGAQLKFMECEPDGSLDLNKVEALITARTRVVALQQVSNVLGREYPIRAVAELAHRVGAVLVVDARGAAHSVLAVIGGFLNLHPKSHIRGVILNRCSAMLYPRMKQAIADQFGGAVLPLGYLPVMKDCTLESRHLGLITAQEMTDLQEKLEVLADQIEKSVDIPALLSLAASAPALSWEPVALPEEGPALRIAVARDNAFCFYYEDNLDLLRSLGAELVPFSPIADAALPENIRGLYLGGGYPELYAESLSENQSMKDSIRRALEAGLPCIAECGGFLYLQKELGGRPMVGFLPGTGHNTGKLSRFGYVTLTAQKDNLLCAAGEQLPAHEFHYYDTTCNGEDFLAQKADGRAWRCGIATENLYAGFPHFHFYAHPQMAARFLEMCRKGSPERPERI